MKAHCLFEQSGTFKNEFKKLGIEAEDYDILDDFGETENQCDLFKAICDSYDGKQTVLDNISSGDVVMAFFPCTRFESQIILEMRGEQYIANGKKRIDWFGVEDTLKYSMKLNGELNKMYEYISKLAILCIRGGWKMVIENPWSEQHYLVRYWPLKSDMIDRNRRERGDYYKKPTQYWFIGFKPCHNTYMFHENYGDLLTIASTRNAVKRSMIHPYYARRFILEHVIPQRDELMM